MMMKKVLVVDDSATFRQLLCMGLSRIEAIRQASITEATDGEDALRKVRDGHFDLVLTDIRMPRLDGLEFVRQVRNGLGNRELPIIIISTKGEETDIEMGMSIGASGYLSKPISISRLKDIVISFLGE